MKGCKLEIISVLRKQASKQAIIRRALSKVSTEYKQVGCLFQR